tara:strand:+ start:2155 stop:2535 length:381 start_codon:yes stop_codon:yes gene_type:complete
MTDENTLDEYPTGPGYRKDCESSKDGAKMVAPVKQTQEEMLMPLAVKAGPAGVTYAEAEQVLGDAIRPDVIRARLSSLKRAGKLVKLPDRRMGDFKVRISPYCLPQYAPKPDDGQGDMLSDLDKAA